ncbi:sensor histidine kinase [Alkalibacterium sp. f15]|uniref:sensor histidine kinase n=1 Tax=Alkalibacterium sp. f15 TaxID=3414029 RepID=UPI003BF918D7
MLEKWRFYDKVFSLFIVTLFLIAASGISYLFDQVGFPETNIVIVYLLAVILISRFTKGYGFGIMASIAGTLLFNYLFTSPYYTLTVDNPSYFITFIIMTTTALITSALTTQAKKNTIKAQEKEAEMKALYNLTSRLTDALDIHQIASISTKMLSDALNCKASCLCFDENGDPEDFYIQQSDNDKQVHIKIEDSNDIKHHIEGIRMGHVVNQESYDWPIYGQENILGVIRIPIDNAEALDETQKRILHSMIENTALAMDRVHLSYQRLKSHEETTQERYRGNLLRGISHDLRTPLSGITATSEMLLGMTDTIDPRFDMIKAINNDSIWLHSLVENVLSLTRLQNGKLALTKEKEAVEEIIDQSVRQIKKRKKDLKIEVTMPDEIVLIPMDAKLIMQVFINLLENAIEHSPDVKVIEIVVEYDTEDKKMIVKVIDNGSGIGVKDINEIFEPFYTSSGKHADAKNRIGLGLSICETIVIAHGGEIKAQNREDNTGAEFIFTLPMEDDR